MSVLTSIKTLISKSLLIGLFCSAVSGFAATVELVSRETSGSAATRDGAIIEALIEAARQLNGITIDSERTLRTSLQQTESEVKLRVEHNDQIRSRTKGLIHSYEVLDAAEHAGQWTAKLLVTIPQYRSPGPDRTHLRSIAVLPFRVTRLIPQASTRRWEQNLVTHLAQSRRFRVLDREFSAELDAELTRLRAGDVRFSDLLKAGQKIGADYIVAGEISNFDMKLDNERNLISEAAATVEYRVIELATSEVRWANTASTFHNLDSLRRLGVVASQPQVQDFLFNSLADVVATQILDAIYPIKVLKVAPKGIVYLNQGGNRVHPGQWFSVSGGDEAIDPDTGLTIRLDGPELALLAITKVHEKYSEARVEQGSAEEIKSAMITRRLSRDRLLAMQREVQTQQLAEQENSIRSGKCPPFIVRPFRTSSGWTVAVKNTSEKPVSINGLARRIAGGLDISPFSLTLRPGAEESFGLPHPFATGDLLELQSDSFERPFLVTFP